MKPIFLNPNWRTWTTVGSLMLLSLACSPAPESPLTTAPTPAASSVSSPQASPAATPASANQAVDGLKHDLQEALASAKANKLEAAKVHFKAFDQAWDAVEDGIKAKSKSAYTAIEDRMEEVENTLVRPTKPKPQQAIAALESLEKTLDQSLKGL